ncbi:toll-like receptor 4 [Physella acuta]|uniref:toll-like receptor 4 n=1 Tax=Physella acuta TaxID=109671 RepID=UPI0027DD397D|nr:toll-like receptor 4 [Physella acuta]
MAKLLCLLLLNTAIFTVMGDPLVYQHRQQESPCSVVSSMGDVTVDCTNKGIRQINPTWFPENATQIFLSNNLIKTVENFTFENISCLLVLSIAYNNIDTLEVNAFWGLENLQVLNIDNNKIDITNGRSFPELVLQPLKNLKELKLRQGLKISTGKYPVRYFSCHSTLNNLSIDTINDEVYFGLEFLNFTRLTRLEFGGSAKYLTSKTFENVQALRELYIPALENIEGISHDIFVPLRNLDVLHLEKVPYGIRRTLSLLWPFRGKNMSSIILYQIPYNFFATDQSLLRHDSFLFANMTENLTNICLRSFNICDNYIFVITEEALNSQMWDSCLRSLDISQNPIKGNELALVKILRLKNLKFFAIGDELRFTHSRDFNWMAYFTPTETTDLDKLQDTSTKIVTKEKASTEMGSRGIQIYFSKSLKIVRAARVVSSSKFNRRFNFVGAKNFELLDLSDSGFKNFSEPLHGLIGLRYLDLSSTHMSIMTENWFDYLPKLETLVLSNCQLDANFMAKKSGRLFSQLKSLERLDLSSNSLTLLADDMFANNSHLKMLRLADNRFCVVPFNLKYTPNLTFLDLSNNALVTLDVETRQMFDQFAQGKEGFQLYLDGNILSCGCESLSFLQWLMSTNVTFDKGGIFSCMDQNGVVTNTSTYRNLDVLWRKCWGEFFLHISLVVFCLIIIGLLSTFVINKKLTYIAHYVIQLFGGFKFQTAADYKTGVFIGYAENDYRFACHTLRSFVEDNLGMTTFIRDRDILVGPHMFSQIVEAINSSWRIVLVFNQTFLLNDDWMMLAFRYAIYAQTPANPNRVIVLVDEKHPYNLPTELLNAVVEDNIVVVRHWVMTYELREKLRTLLCPIS